MRKLFGGIPAFETLLTLPGWERFYPFALGVDELFEVLRFHGAGEACLGKDWPASTGGAGVV